jgi:hypothetical protein
VPDAQLQTYPHSAQYRRRRKIQSRKWLTNQTQSFNTVHTKDHNLTWSLTSSIHLPSLQHIYLSKTPISFLVLQFSKRFPHKNSAFIPGLSHIQATYPRFHYFNKTVKLYISWSSHYIITELPAYYILFKSKIHYKFQASALKLRSVWENSKAAFGKPVSSKCCGTHWPLCVELYRKFKIITNCSVHGAHGLSSNTVITDYSPFWW